MSVRSNSVSNFFHWLAKKSKQRNRYRETQARRQKVRVISTGDQYQFAVYSIFVGHHTVYRMSASSDDERKDWIRALRIGTQNELPKQRSS